MDKQRKRNAKIGLMQVTANYEWSVEQCQEQMLRLAEESLKEGADLVFMPEGFQYKTAERKLTPVELSQKYSEGYKKRCIELAKRYHAYVVPWDYESDGEAVYNVSYILDSHGNVIGKYRKVHPTYSEKKKGITAGDNFPVFDLNFGKVGIMICFDNYFAESARILSLRGAELILYPLYGDTLKNQWEIKLKARAIDNTVYIAPCHIHSSPVEAKVTYTGMIGPAGEVLCKLENENCVKLVEIEMGKRVITICSGVKGKYEDIKQQVLKLRNTAAYRPLLEEVDTPEWNKIHFED